MKIKKILAVMMASLLLWGAIAMFGSAAEIGNPDEYGFVDVGSTKIEYGVYGDESLNPVVLLPGNGGDMHSFDGNILKGLIGKYRVICISPRGTGKTFIGNESLTFELEAADLIAVLDYLKIEKTDIFGFSDGGNLGIVFTLLYPERVSHLCIESPNINIFGTNTFTQIQYIYQYLVLCIRCMIHPDNMEYVRQREIKGMMAHQPNLSFDDLSAIKVPTLHIFAEYDMFFRWHSKKITKSISGCKEIIVPKSGHSEALEYWETIQIPALEELFAQ